MKMNEQTRQAGLRLLAALEARDVAEMNKRAVGWIVLSIDEVFNTHYIVGPFTEPAAALEYEQKMAADLATLHDETTKGWTTSVLPLMPPT